MLLLAASGRRGIIVSFPWTFGRNRLHRRSKPRGKEARRRHRTKRPRTNPPMPPPQRHRHRHRHRSDPKPKRQQNPRTEQPTPNPRPRPPNPLRRPPGADKRSDFTRDWSGSFAVRDRSGSDQRFCRHNPARKTNCSSAIPHYTSDATIDRIVLIGNHGLAERP